MSDLARLDRALRAESKCELLVETLALVTTAYHEREAECEALRAKLDEAMPLIAALAIYGENANLAALAAKARELNEAHRAALGEANERRRPGINEAELMGEQ